MKELNRLNVVLCEKKAYKQEAGRTNESQSVYCVKVVYPYISAGFGQPLTIANLKSNGATTVFATDGLF